MVPASYSAQRKRRSLRPSLALGVPREAVHAAEKPGETVAAVFILRFQLKLK